MRASQINPGRNSSIALAILFAGVKISSIRKPARALEALSTRARTLWRRAGKRSRADVLRRHPPRLGKAAPQHGRRLFAGDDGEGARRPARGRAADPPGD